ncbi:MAG: FAD-binding oxidoreductase [Proteobacteria bacterium]|nr:FAD-binding oxidoreductase [Pseudomonadota bacterium]
MNVMRVKEHHPLYGELAMIVGSKFTTDSDFALWAYSRDSSPVPGKVPGIIVRPGSTEEVSEIIKLANLTHTPVIPRGGGASIFGFPAGIPGRSIVIDTTRLDKIIEINEENMTVTAEAGIGVCELGTKLTEKGYYANLVWAPYYADTLGGLIGGVMGGGWSTRTQVVGPNANHILGMKIVTPTGGVIQTGGGPGTNVHRKTTFMRDGGGPDTTGIFIGDGGTFGIKTEVTLSIYPLETVAKPRGFLFKSFDDIWNAMSRLMAIEPFPYTNLVGLAPNATALFMKDPCWVLLCYTRGYEEEEVTGKIKVVDEVCKAAGGEMGSEAIHMQASAAGTGEMYREMGKLASIGMWVFLETHVPKEDLPRLFNKYAELIDQRFEEKGIKEYGGVRMDVMLPVGHGECYLSTNVYWQVNVPEARKKVMEIADEFVNVTINDGLFATTAQRIPAGVTGANWSPSYYEFMRTLKKAMDPNNIINPGHWGL